MAKKKREHEFVIYKIMNNFCILFTHTCLCVCIIKLFLKYFTYGPTIYKTVRKLMKLIILVNKLPVVAQVNFLKCIQHI